MGSRDDFEPGRIVGGHQIVRQLGTGTFGSVYEARRMPIGRRVALKVLHQRFATHAEVTQRFLREAEVVARLEHPNIVGVIDLGVHEGRPFLTMQLLEGETLAQRITRGAMTVDDALEHILPILSAVEAAHHHGVVHRDLKPENIFLELLSTGRVESRLLDFGIAKLEEASLAMTGTSAMMGTPYYMPPEQVAGAIHADARSDVWALGAILFEMVTGARPFQGDTIADIFMAITVHPTPSIRSLRPGLPVALDAVISHALAKKPEARWPAARDLAMALLPLANATLRAQWEESFSDPFDGTMVETSAPRQRSEVTQKLGTIVPDSYAVEPHRPAPRSVQERVTQPPAAAPSASTLFVDGVKAPAHESPASTLFVEDVKVPSQAASPASTMFVDDVKAPSISTPRYDPSARPPPVSNTSFVPHGAAGTMLSDGPPPDSPELAGTMAMPPDASLGRAPTAAATVAPLPGMPPAMSAATKAPPGKPRRSRWWIAAAVVGLLVGGVAVAFELFDDTVDVPPAVTTSVSTTVDTAAPTGATPAAAPLGIPAVAPSMPIPTALPEVPTVPPVAMPDAGSPPAATRGPRRPRRRRRDEFIPGLIDSF
jgi:serine/threonine protein kinase